MSIKVRFLPEDEIEKEANLLLAEYTETIGAPIKLPVSVDEITTYHLALRLGFADLHETLRIPMLRNRPDILGAIWVENETVLIDHSLDPEKNPAMTGRYRFSVAHEIGHWRLHRSYVVKHADQDSLFVGPSEPTIICRSIWTKEQIEWQADFYASCLLMPRKLVLAAWAEMFPDRKRRVIKPSAAVSHPFVEVPRVECRIPGIEFTESINQAFDRFAQPFAEKFLVSPIAMRIRLEKLGLLLREVPHQRISAKGL